MTNIIQYLISIQILLINTQVDNKQTYYSASNNVLMINVPTPQS